jgi:predicted CXXCH cytochrome family protein
MSKIKLGFSFILTLVLVGLMSAVAFASAAGPKIADWNSSDGHLDFTWEAVAGATDYQLFKVLPGADPVEITLADGAMSYSVDGLANSSTVEWEVVAVDGTGAEVSETVFYMTAGGPKFNKEMSADRVALDTDNDNGIVNANQTGKNVGGQTDKFSDVIKSSGMTNKDGSTSTHRTHGDYANNTNSCASCHQTHTAASKNLLFKNGVYATCTACHDGTLGFYNVFEKGSDSAGTFGGTEAGNMSVHLATGAVSIKAAPGGNKNGEGSWGGEFTCASCHAPHGSYSDRLLNYNPNDMAVTPVSEGGLKLEGVKVVEGAEGVPTPPSTKTDDIIALRTKKLTEAAAAAFPQLGANATVIQLYKWDNTDTDAVTEGVQPKGYVLETTPWVYTGTYDSTHTYKVYDTAFWASKPTTTEKDIYMAGDIVYPLKKNEDIRQANNWIGSPDTKTAKIDAVTVGDVARAYVVDLDLKADPAFPGKPVFTTKVVSLWNGLNWDETGAKKSGKGVVMSNFCAACHTDYLAKSGSESGTYSHAYRHTTTSDTYSCVRCHFAHGTDVTVMRDAQGNTAQDLVTKGEVADLATAQAYLLDKDPSSALKRYTNMSVCWGCHTSSHAEGIRNSSTYGDDSDDPMPGGLKSNQ